MRLQHEDDVHALSHSEHGVSAQMSRECWHKVYDFVPFSMTLFLVDCDIVQLPDDACCMGGCAVVAVEFCLLLR